jgi:hypothetical protein
LIGTKIEAILVIMPKTTIKVIPGSVGGIRDRIKSPWDPDTEENSYEEAHR